MESPISSTFQLPVVNASFLTSSSELKYMKPPSQNLLFAVPPVLISRSLEYLNLKDLLVTQLIADPFIDFAETAWEIVDKGNLQWAVCKEERNKKKWNVILTKAFRIFHQIISRDVIYNYFINNHLLINQSDAVMQTYHEIEAKFSPLIEKFPSYGCYFQYKLFSSSKKFKKLKTSANLEAFKKGKQKLRQLVRSAANSPLAESIPMMLMKLDELRVHKETEETTKNNIKESVLQAFKHNEILVVKYIKIFLSKRNFNVNLDAFFRDCALELTLSNSCALLECLVSHNYASGAHVHQGLNQWMLAHDQRPEIHYFKALLLIEQLHYFQDLNPPTAHSSLNSSIQAIESFKTSIKKLENDVPCFFLDKIINKINFILNNKPVPPHSFLIQLQSLLSLIIEKYGTDVSFIALFLIMTVKYELNLYDESQIYCELLIRKFRNHAPIHHFIRGATIQQKLKNFAGAEALWDIALERDENKTMTPSQIVEIASNKVNLEKFEEADSFFNQAIKMFGDDVPSQVLIEAGKNAVKSNNFLKADTLWHMAVKKEPAYMTSYSQTFAIIENQVKIKKFKEAEHSINQIFKKYPNNFLIKIFLLNAETKFHLKKYSEAEIYFIRILNKEEGVFSPELLRMFILNQLELEKLEVIANFSQSLLEKLRLLPFALEKNCGLSPLGIVALSKFNVGKYEEAKDLFTEEIARFQDNSIPIDSPFYADLIDRARANQSQLK